MKWLKVTSVYTTPVFVRAESVIPGHRGCRLELLGGQWTTSYHCLETVDEVAKLLGIVQ